MVLKLCMDHQGLNVYKVCINKDPGPWLDLVFTARSSLVKFDYCADTRPLWSVERLHDNWSSGFIPHSFFTSHLKVFTFILSHVSLRIILRN